MRPSLVIANPGNIAKEREREIERRRRRKNKTNDDIAGLQLID